MPESERDEGTVAKYSPSTLQGNWLEESYKKKDELLDLVNKMRKGELMHQYAGKFFSRHETNVNLSSDNPYVHYGDKLMIINPLIKSEQPRYADRTYTGLSASVVFMVQDYIRSPEILPNMRLGGSGEITPSLRNVFCIESIDPGKKEGDKLCYGENFAMSILHSYGNRKLYVECLPPHLSAPIGYTQKVLVTLVPDFSVYCRWKVMHVDPTKRYSANQTPVPANTNLLIVHSSTNQPLHAIDYWFPTIFGHECELTIERHENQFKRPEAGNVWQLRNDSTPGAWATYVDVVNERDKRHKAEMEA